MLTRATRWVSMGVLALAPIAAAQPIDFETLPDGTPTVDLQEISDQYAPRGVTFTLVDRTTGAPIGFPNIAKAGSPQTAFEGCAAPDTPRPGQSLGSSFLTDGTSLGITGDVVITYVTPVSQASGVILDVDCRVNGGPPCEQWTVTAFDPDGATLDQVVIDAPSGMEDPSCINPDAGPGDSLAFGWVFDLPGQDIGSIRFSHTSPATNVGLAFDNFSPGGTPAPLDVTAQLSIPAPCFGQAVELVGEASGGFPPYAFTWERETAPDVWEAFSSDVATPIVTVADAIYRVSVTDALDDIAISAPVPVDVDPVIFDVSQESAPGLGDFGSNVLGTVEPYTTDDPAATYYGWNPTTTPPFSGPAPPLTDDRSHMFLLLASDGVSLFVVQDDPAGPVGGRSEMRLELTNDTAAFLVRDDANNDAFTVLAGDAEFRTRLTWSSGFTDGFVIGALDCDWTMDVQFADVFGGAPTIGGLDSWAVHSADGSPIALVLEEGRRARLRAVGNACPCEFDDDPAQVNVLDLLAYLAAWFANDPGAEVDGTPGVDVLDLLAFLACWFDAAGGGPCP